MKNETLRDIMCIFAFLHVYWTLIERKTYLWEYGYEKRIIWDIVLGIFYGRFGRSKILTWHMEGTDRHFPTLKFPKNNVNLPHIPFLLHPSQTTRQSTTQSQSIQLPVNCTKTLHSITPYSAHTATLHAYPYSLAPIPLQAQIKPKIAW